MVVATTAVAVASPTFEQRLTENHPWKPKRRVSSWSTISYGSREHCLQYDAGIVGIDVCSASGLQNWKYDAGSSTLQHSSSMCLEWNAASLHLASCNATTTEQQWVAGIGSANRITGSDGRCLSSTIVNNQQIPVMSVCGIQDHQPMELRGWSSCHDQYSCESCSLLRSISSSGHAESMCSWCRTSKGARCNTNTEQCSGIVDQTSCAKEPSIHLGLTAIIITLCLFCLFTCYCHREAVGKLVHWILQEVKGNNDAHRREEIGRHYDGNGQSPSSTYRTGRGRHGSNPRAELRPGQQELMDLRRQWHAQRAARREAAQADGEIDSETRHVDMVQSYRNPEFDAALQWEIEQDIMMELAARASARSQHREQVQVILKRQIIEEALEALKALGSVKATEVHKQDSCCICLNDYEMDEEIQVLRCGHMFHCGCIKDWVTRAQNCPICKESVMPADSISKASRENCLVIEGGIDDSESDDEIDLDPRDGSMLNIAVVSIPRPPDLDQNSEEYSYTEYGDDVLPGMPAP